MASTIQVRVDDDLKIKSDALFKDLGTDTTTAIRMFLMQALAVNGFPFEIKGANANPYEVLTEHEILDKLEKSREHAAQRMYKGAAENVLNDYDVTIESLKRVAGSLKLCDNTRLRQLEYRRINFLNHRYFMLYRIVDNVVFVDNIFYELQDYENKMY